MGILSRNWFKRPCDHMWFSCRTARSCLPCGLNLRHLEAVEEDFQTCYLTCWPLRSLNRAGCRQTKQSSRGFARFQLEHFPAKTFKQLETFMFSRAPPKPQHTAHQVMPIACAAFGGKIPEVGTMVKFKARFRPVGAENIKKTHGTSQKLRWKRRFLRKFREQKLAFLLTRCGWVRLGLSFFSREHADSLEGRGAAARFSQFV